MITCSKYVDPTAKQFSGKSELEIWLMLQPEHQQWILANELLECIHESIIELGEKIGEAVIAVMATKTGSTETQV